MNNEWDDGWEGMNKDGLKKMLKEDLVVFAIAQGTEIERLRGDIRLLLDNVDYMSGMCRPTEMVSAVLPKEVIMKVRNDLP